MDWHQCTKRAGAQEPHCAKGRDPRTPASWRHCTAAWLSRQPLDVQRSDPSTRSTYVLALFVYVVTLSAGLRWTDAKHRVLLFFHGDQSLEHVHRRARSLPALVVSRSPFLDLTGKSCRWTKVFLPLGLWASLRHHDLLAPRLPGACSRVRQSLDYDLLQEYFSTYFPFPQHDQDVILFPSPRRLRRTLLVYLCQAAWYIAARHILVHCGGTFAVSPGVAALVHTCAEFWHCFLAQHDITHATDVLIFGKACQCASPWICWSYAVGRMWPLLRPAGVL